MHMHPSGTCTHGGQTQLHPRHPTSSPSLLKHCVVTQGAMTTHWYQGTSFAKIWQSAQYQNLGPARHSPACAGCNHTSRLPLLQQHILGRSRSCYSPAALQSAHTGWPLLTTTQPWSCNNRNSMQPAGPLPAPYRSQVPPAHLTYTTSPIPKHQHIQFACSDGSLSSHTYLSFVSPQCGNCCCAQGPTPVSVSL
jgi:hypothetical protein